MNPEQRMIDAALANWKLTLKRIDGLFSEFTDEQFYQQIAPGRNRIVYILGHLTAVHDRMIPLLGFGERRHIELDGIFITSPDRTVEPLPSVADLKQSWAEVNNLLLEGYLSLTPKQWLGRHTAVSEEDFATDPTRNRFTLFLNRTNHTAFHLGQLVLVRTKQE